VTRTAGTKLQIETPVEPRPATARLRAELLIAPDAETLVALFAAALAEHGVGGHFCLLRRGGQSLPLLGDAPALIGAGDALVIDCGAPFSQSTRMLLARPRAPLDRAATARLQGFAELYAARALALHELADDVATECGLTLRQRYVLGRRLAGLAPVDVAAEAGLSVATVSALTDGAVERLGAASLADATALAARRGWLAVTSLENCSSSPENLTYKLTKNG
jgi:DNA-binding CsgD family transcriptional regulator